MMALVVKAISGMFLVFVMFSGSTALTCNPEETCPPTWTYWNESCYVLTTETFTWFDAVAKCITMEGKMMAPQSQEENDFIQDMIQDTGLDHWILCNDLAMEGQWVCGGDSNFTYRAWEPREPNNHHEGSECARMTPIGQWADFPCTRLFPTICIRDASKLFQHFSPRDEENLPTE